MSDPVLDPGRAADDDSYRPPVTLQHDADRSELYVVVGEEVGGMIEGVSKESFDAMRQNLRFGPCPFCGAGT